MARKIKIAFFAEILIEDFDGASRTIFQIIKRIPTEQFELLFFCGVPPNEDFQYQFVEVPTVKIPFNEDYRVAIPYFQNQKLKNTLDNFSPDIIHISTPSPLGKFGLNYGKSHNIPVTTIYHTHFISYIDYYLEKIPFLIKPVKKLIERSQRNFYNKCSKIYVPTVNMVKELVTIGISNKNMEIWPRGLNTQNFNSKKKDLTFLRNITKNNRPNILFASRLVWEKNVKTLIQIYKTANSKGLEYNFIIAGDGVASTDMKREMPDAFFLGNLNHEKLSTVYASCDVFLFTSISETYGNVVAEAMASGLPCVIANGGGSASFIQNGVNGFLCNPRSAFEYIDKIEVLLNDDVLRDQFIQKGITFSESLSWEVLTDKYFNDLKYLVNSKNTNTTIYQIEKQINVAFGHN